MAEGTDDICKKRGSIDLERDVILSEANTEEAGGEETAHKHKAGAEQIVNTGRHV